MSPQSPFFGKRPQDPITRPTHNQPGAVPGYRSGEVSNTPAAPAPTPAPVAAASNTESSVSSAPTKEGGSKLTVGPNIKLKGVEITDCDTLFVEGTVEATIDSRVMHITNIGTFNGSAEIDYAEIHGAFNGDLTVRQKLVIHSTGRVNGKIRYGNVVIEEGGQLIGDIQFGSANKAEIAQPLKMGLIASQSAAN